MCSVQSGYYITPLSSLCHRILRITVPVLQVCSTLVSVDISLVHFSSLCHISNLEYDSLGITGWKFLSLT